MGQAQSALQLQLALPTSGHAALHAALSACAGVHAVDATVLDAALSKWRISWNTAGVGEAPGAVCDQVLRIVLAHAQVRAVLSLHDAVETRLLAALAPNDPVLWDPVLRRRA
ncbi:hypothetical protein D3C71_1547570 [compost metagenome]